MITKKITAVLIIAVLAMGGAAAAVMMNDEGGEGDRSFTITDSAGQTFSFDGPVSKVAVSNSTAAAMIEILGQEDKIAAIDDESKNIAGGDYADVENIGKYTAPSGDIILGSGASVLICKSGSRTLSNEAELTNMGIKVIRLDCFGDTMISDMEQLVKLLGGNAEERANLFLEFYEPIIKQIKGIDTDSSDDESFLFMFTSMKKPYSISSELGRITESITGVNALRAMNDNSTGASSSIAQETIFDYDHDVGIDRIILRSAARDVGVTKAYSTFIGIDDGTYYANLGAVSRGDVYIIDTEVLSGPLDFIGYICIAKAMGLITDLDPDALLEEFNGIFGFEIPARDYLYRAYGSDNIVPIV